MDRYNFKIIEKNGRNIEDNKTFIQRYKKTKKILLLRNVPYPLKIHMGHKKLYNRDVLARFKALQGFTCYIQWVGILLECQQKMRQDKTI